MKISISGKGKANWNKMNAPKSSHRGMSGLRGKRVKGKFGLLFDLEEIKAVDDQLKQLNTAGQRVINIGELKKNQRTQLTLQDYRIGEKVMNSEGIALLNIISSHLDGIRDVDFGTKVTQI